MEHNHDLFENHPNLKILNDIARLDNMVTVMGKKKLFLINFQLEFELTLVLV